jgi:putative transposase
MMESAETLAHEVGLAASCQALGIARAAYYRFKSPKIPKPRYPRPSPARALDPPERQTVLGTLHSEEFIDQAPPEVYYSLLERGVYPCSIKTMYNLLNECGEVRERRDQLRHPEYKKPELLATGPNQVWSWDITKLLGPQKWTYYYLYVILDIYSRYAPGWLLAGKESADLAERLIDETCAKQGIDKGQLIIHSDRGPSMQSKTVAQLMADLGVVKSLSRPHVSNDNPFSESQFKTLKYRPEFPRRFSCQREALDFCRNFFNWYNNEHHHSGIVYLTPAIVHTGQAVDILSQRHSCLLAAYADHPERFVNGPPRMQTLPPVVYINPPERRDACPTSLY